MYSEFKLLTNGFPKSGTHALVKACQLLGQNCQVNHIEYSTDISFNKQIFIKRDPRNIVISWLRQKMLPITNGTIIGAIKLFQEDSLFNELNRYSGWLNDPNTFVVSYENLIANDLEMKKIAKYLDIEYLEDSWEYLPGMTKTWNEEHSNYLNIWDASIESCWSEYDGNSILKIWGYV